MLLAVHLKQGDTMKTPNSKLVSAQSIILILILLIPIVSSATLTAATVATQIKIGVLGYRGAEEAEKSWLPTANHLTNQIPGYSFEVIPYDLNTIKTAVKNNEVDFVITNPASCVELEYLYVVTRILTVKKEWKGYHLNVFGSVIFTKSDRTDITTLNDLKGKSVMAVETTSFGGFWIAWRELKQLGIDPYKDFSSFLFSGFPQDSVVYAILNGTAEVGIVRTGILESMNMEGKINLSDFKIINKQTSDDFPLLHSTQLYPEWAFGKLRHTSLALSERVAVALLSMPEDHPSIRAADYAHWTIPLDYTPVHELMKELNVSPYEDYGKVTLTQVIKMYWHWILTGFLLTLTFVFLSVYSINASRKLKIFNIGLEEQVEKRTAELRESEQYNRALFNQSPIGLALTAMDGRLVDVNPAYANIIGRTIEETLNLTYWDITPKCYAKQEQKQLDTLNSIGSYGPYEKEYIRKDGHLVPVQLQGLIIEKGSEKFIWSSVEDITERKRAEEKIRISEERFRSFVEQASEGIYLFELKQQIPVNMPVDEQIKEIYKGDIAECNDVQAKMYGYSKADEVIGKLLSEFHGGTDNPENIEFLRLFIESGYRITNAISSEVDKDGNPVWFSNNVIGIVENDYLVRIWGTQTDITERKRAEEKISRYNERLRILNNLNRVISSNLDLEKVWDKFIEEMGRLIQLDRTSIVLLNDAKDEWAIVRQWTRHTPAFTTGEWRKVHGSVIELVIQNRKPFIENEIGEKGEWPESEFLRKEGIHSQILLPLIIQSEIVGILTQASSKPNAYSETDLEILIPLADQMAIAIQNSTLYQQVQLHAAELEQRVNQRTAQLEAANKELEAFSYSVSHDLRAPLRAIDGFTEILFKDYEPQLDAEGKRICSVISKSARNMGKLIDDLLTFSRLGRAEMRLSPIDMATLANSVFFELTTPESRERIDFHVGKLPQVMGDPTLIRQVWMNLLSNAIKFSSKKERAIIEVSGERTRKETSYSVRDNGAGFDMQYVDKLFGVFQRLHSTRGFEGTGVGLAIVQRVIHRHGGRVWAEGATNNGATFYFTIKHEGT